MPSEPAAPRSLFSMPANATAEQRALVLRHAVEVLAGALDSAWVDEPAPGRVDAASAASLQLLRELAEAQVQEGRLPRSDEPHLGVDVDDLANPRQRHMFAELAVLGAGEAYAADEELLLAVSEDGSSVRLELTPAEAERLLGILSQTGAGLVLRQI